MHFKVFVESCNRLILQIQITIYNLQLVFYSTQALIINTISSIFNGKSIRSCPCNQLANNPNKHEVSVKQNNSNKVTNIFCDFETLLPQYVDIWSHIFANMFKTLIGDLNIISKMLNNFKLTLAFSLELTTS